MFALTQAGNSMIFPKESQLPKPHENLLDYSSAPWPQSHGSTFDPSMSGQTFQQIPPARLQDVLVSADLFWRCRHAIAILLDVEGLKRHDLNKV